ncbi:MAG: type II/IV secretion system protein [Phycisphaerales bacterium]|nr:type II/IV secretion system protein [Phycisphaerales bacterium]
MSAVSMPPLPAQATTPVDPVLATDLFLTRVPLTFAREHLVLSQGVRNGQEIIALTGGEGDSVVLHNLAVRLGRSCVAVSADAESIALAIDRLAEQHEAVQSMTPSDGSSIAEEDTEVDADLEALLRASDRDLLSTQGRAPVVRLVNGLLFRALQDRASDVHVQPEADQVAVRYRVDGVLRDAQRLPARALEPIVARVKVIAGMDIAERRLPQDGRTTVTIGQAAIDLRVSTLPTALGERLVIRLLDKRDRGKFELSKLGMPEPIQQHFERLCASSHGLILVTGPTGSGKTTTLYSALRRYDTRELNVMTLEDPIEYELPGISQSQVNLKKGVTFASGLRHILRQDPDVIMVGEIRDADTARIAIQSALTGHLVYSTLHTNSAAGAVSRLVDLGVEPYLINASLRAILAQRLVRRRCTSCSDVNQASCEACHGTGFRGRIGLFELLVMSNALRTAVQIGTTVSELQKRAEAEGMTTLRRAGLGLVERAVTTMEEVDRVTLLDAEEID